jgi:hypothetical protein
MVQAMKTIKAVQRWFNRSPIRRAIAILSSALVIGMPQPAQACGMEESGRRFIRAMNNAQKMQLAQHQPFATSLAQLDIPMADPKLYKFSVEAGDAIAFHYALPDIFDIPIPTFVGGIAVDEAGQVATIICRVPDSVTYRPYLPIWQDDTWKCAPETDHVSYDRCFPLKNISPMPSTSRYIQVHPRVQPHRVMFMPDKSAAVGWVHRQS